MAGLPNKQVLEKQLRELAAKKVNPAAYVAVDMDGMKAINDQFGHDAADLMIEQIAGILAKYSKDDGVTAFKHQQGGDEFGLVIQGMDKQQVLAYVEQVRTMIGTVTRTTASFGIAMRNNDVASIWMRNAEAALHLAKNSGKNKCVLLG